MQQDAEKSATCLKNSNLKRLKIPVAIKILSDIGSAESTKELLEEAKVKLTDHFIIIIIIIIKNYLIHFSRICTSLKGDGQCGSRVLSAAVGSVSVWSAANGDSVHAARMLVALRASLPAQYRQSSDVVVGVADRTGNGLSERPRNYP